MSEILKADTRKTSNLLKKHLRQKFGIDCKIKSESYSGGSSINVTYILGPDRKEVESEVTEGEELLKDRAQRLIVKYSQA